jgi:hypothetical protein
LEQDKQDLKEKLKERHEASGQRDKEMTLISKMFRGDITQDQVSSTDISTILDPFVAFD